MKRKIVGGFRLLRKNQNLTLALVAFGVIAGLALTTDYWLFYRGAYLTGALIPVAFIWARLYMHGLQVDVRRGGDRLLVGQYAEAQVNTRSRSPMTKVWLELEDQTDMPGAAARTVISLGAQGNRTWSLKTLCRRRGAFFVGPVKVITGDPFGVFRFSREFGEAQTVLVLPQPEDIPQFWAPPADLTGERSIRRPSQFITTNAVGIREYRPGDSFNRIHWRSTARMNQLMVKTFDMDPSSSVWVILDQEKAAQAGEGDDSTEEYAVRAAASIASHLLQSNILLGYISHGKERAVLEPARGSNQQTLVLENLARAKADGHIPLGQLLTEEGKRFGRHSTVVVVTPSVDERWMAALQTLVQQGTRAAVVLLDAASFGKSGARSLPAGMFGRSGVVTYLLRCGDDLSSALGPGGILSEPSAAAREMAPAGRRG